ncbi:MAG: alkyl hydroperoxide reductase/Thiol specific antioxidant/Mal allergen, partial [Actinomycetia bacterium]|nr:alkyl hydroperoxide reductase/Thiol specific antioxidant/Mal allergen [Actinomycetes bacterium]
MAAAAPPDQAPLPRPKGPVRSGRRLILVVLVVVAVVLPAAASLLGRRAPATRPEPLTPPAAPSTAVQTYPAGTPAPALRLPGLDGAEVDLAALRGRPVVVNFWATWCEPCVREFPLLRSAAADHRGRRLVVVGVLTGDRPAAARAFVRRHRATWPVGPPHVLRPRRRHPRLPPARRAQPRQPGPAAGRDPLACPSPEPRAQPGPVAANRKRSLAGSTSTSGSTRPAARRRPLGAGAEPQMLLVHAGEGTRSPPGSGGSPVGGGGVIMRWADPGR